MRSLMTGTVRFALLMFVVMYVGRKTGWLVSRKLLYRESGTLLILLCAFWGVAIASLVRVAIIACNPGAVSRWIFGYALGAYIAIPNYGLFAESTIPPVDQPKHRRIANIPLLVYAVASVCLVYVLAYVRQEAPGTAVVKVLTRPTESMPRSVRNFLFSIDALSRADARPSGITSDSNVHRVAAIFREAIDSSEYVDRAELNGVYSGLGDHFFDDAVPHMGAIVRVESQQDEAAIDQATASIRGWQRWWNANRGAALQAITARYPK
jgi:hypothetical protein